MSGSTIEKRFLKHTNVISSLEEAIKKEVWDKNPFLKVYKKNLQNLKDKFSTEIGIETYMSKSHGAKLNKDKNRSGELKVFISIYSSDGADLDKWSLIIQGMIGKAISRPVYRVEEDVKSFIKSKSNIQNEGYLIIYVNNNDLLTSKDPDASKDLLGNELSTLRDKCIKKDNIAEFIHDSNGYVFKENKLIPTEMA